MEIRLAWLLESNEIPFLFEIIIYQRSLIDIIHDPS